MATVLTAVDTIHKYVDNIPANDPQIQRVMGYVTGSGDIPWDKADWDRFPHYEKLTIAQRPNHDPAADFLDVEPYAAGDAEAIQWVKNRHAAKKSAHIYISASGVAELYKDLAAAKALDQTYLWLADWSLSVSEATALLGTEYDGIKVEMVQWASPTSNPKTLLPGTTYTLADAGCDLSVGIPLSRWREPAVKLVSVMAVATYSDGSRKSWSVA